MLYLNILFLIISKAVLVYLTLTSVVFELDQNPNRIIYVLHLTLTSVVFESNLGMDFRIYMD